MHQNTVFSKCYLSTLVTEQNKCCSLEMNVQYVRTLCCFHNELGFDFSLNFGRLSRNTLLNNIQTYHKIHRFIKNSFYINTKVKCAFLEVLKEKGMYSELTCKESGK